jgi:hypothetical protein
MGSSWTIRLCFQQGLLRAGGRHGPIFFNSINISSTEQDEQTVFVFNKACFKQGAGTVPTDDRAHVVRAELPTQEQSLSSSSNLSLKAMQVLLLFAIIIILVIAFCFLLFT